MSNNHKFKSFIHGGFECSTHIHNGKRLNLLESTGHIRFCSQDYAELKKLNIQTVREGLSWNLIEKSKGVYDFSSALPIVKAANEYEIEVIWDLCHYGFPDGLTTDDKYFCERFTQYAIACIKFLKENYHGKLFICPFNEPSFLAKSLADFGEFNSSELKFSNDAGKIKESLIKATINAIREMRKIAEFQVVHVDPLIHIAYPDDTSKEEVRLYRKAQFESLDMLLGRIRPELGGQSDFVDIIGLNHYPYSNWIHRSTTHLSQDNPFYHSLYKQLKQVASLYDKPLYISETGVEGRERKRWLKYVLGELDKAKDDGIEILGVCIYPVTDYPGWADDRYCPCGLFSYPNEKGKRKVYEPLKKVIVGVTS